MVEGINRGFLIFQELCEKDRVFTCQDFRLDNNKTILDKLGFNSEQKSLVLDIKNLLNCCYVFTERLLLEEINYFNEINNKQIVAKLQSIKQQNTPTSPVIRIGKNEGYLSLTIGLLVKDKDKDLYNSVLCHATKNTSYTGNFPKTRQQQVRGSMPIMGLCFFSHVPCDVCRPGPRDYMSIKKQGRYYAPLRVCDFG